MVDASAIAAGVSSLSSAGTILKALLGMKVDQEVRSKIVELQNEILSAQSAALNSLAEKAALLGRIEALEQELRSINSWEDEASRYCLTEFPTGVQVYILREDRANAEPSHRLCPTCFQEKRKSILQVKNKHSGGESVECLICKRKLILSPFPTPQVVSAGRPSSWMDGY